MHIKNKAAILWRLTFSITLLSLFVACEDPGSVGGDFVEKSEISIDTIIVANLIESNEDAYLGRLSRSASGRFVDDTFGEIEAISFFKPSISRSSDTTIFDNSTELNLRLQILENEFYGDTTSVSSYNIYRVSSFWRGSAFTNSDDITYDAGELIGQFTDAEIDTNGFVFVPLTGTWKDDYINYFNMPDETRDEAYKEGDYGLAIVPDVGNSKIVYNSYGLSNVTAYAQDTTSHIILDWATDIDLNNAVVNPDRVVLSSLFDTIYKINLSDLADQIPNSNFVRAELIFKEDTLAITSTLEEHEVRSDILGLGLTLGPVDDVPYEIGFGALDISATLEDDLYRFTLTTLLNNYFFGDLEISEVYIFMSVSQGNIGYSSLYSDDADPDDAPKLIIYSLNAGE